MVVFIELQRVAELALVNCLLEAVTGGEVESLVPAKKVGLVGAEGNESRWIVSSFCSNKMDRVETLLLAYSFWA